VHVLDAGGGALAAEAAALPHTGTAIGGADALRTVRLVDRLTQEIAARRAGPRPGKDPLILLLVDGVEAISSLLDDSDPGRGSAHLLRLVRDGAAVGLTCLLTGERAVPGGRLASVAAHRLVLPLPDRADYAVAGIPARAVPAERPPGRALLGEDAWECQLALPGPPPAPWAVSATAATTSPPLRIPELLPDPAVPLGNHPAAAQVPAGLRSLPLPIGPAGDEGEIAAVDLLRTGGLLVAGPPGSGRTDALDAFARHLSANGSPVLRVGPAPRAVSDAAAGAQAWVGPADAAGLETWLRGLDGRPGVVIADDVGSPADVPVLGSLPPIGASTGIALVAAGSAGSLAGHYQGSVATLRRGRTGLLLCPGPGDADLLGIRLPRTPVPVRPGSGWLVSGGSAERVQVGRRRVPERSTTAAADRLPSAPAAENAAGLGARGG
jgi:S-DNA-T family DNA segregation ATPase FtsK/SpoIIIE